MKTLHERLDELAEGLHEHFIAHAAAAEGLTPVDDVFFRFWEELPDELQEAYRECVRALAAGLEPHGLRIDVASSPRGGLLPTVLEPYYDELAELCHHVWVDTLLHYGWTYAPVPTDVVKRTNPWLEPWERLSELKRERVRTFLHALPELLLKDGLRLEKLEYGAAPAEPERPHLPHHHLEGHAGPTLVPPAEAFPPHPPTMAQPPVAPDTLERIARVWHAAYLHHHIEAGESLRDNPALRPWEHLHPDFKQACREEAAHLWEWVHRVGLAIVPQGAPGKPVSAGELQQVAASLAEVEHDLWQSTLLEHGWMPGRRAIGEPADPADKRHPQLVDWDRLLPSSQAAEKAIMRDLPSILAPAGFRLVHEIWQG